MVPTLEKVQLASNFGILRISVGGWARIFGEPTYVMGDCEGVFTDPPKGGASGGSGPTAKKMIFLIIFIMF